MIVRSNQFAWVWGGEGWVARVCEVTTNLVPDLCCDHPKSRSAVLIMNVLQYSDTTLISILISLHLPLYYIQAKSIELEWDFREIHTFHGASQNFQFPSLSEL